MADFSIKQNDTSPALIAELLSNGASFNLTGATVRLHVRHIEGGVLIVDAPVEVLDEAALQELADAGVSVNVESQSTVRYEWQPEDTDEPGLFEMEWEVTWANEQVQTFPEGGYEYLTVTADLDSSEEATYPALPDSCWPIDEGCCADLDSYAPTVQLRAKALAGQTMRMLTGYRVGGCAITVRPCTRSCVGSAGGWYSYGPGFFPYQNSLGQWVNSCGCQTDCDHLGAAQIALPGPVGRVDAVWLDGVELDESVYRVDNGNLLVRLDGGVWPTTQEMGLPLTDAGTFGVTYLQGIPVDGLGAWAAGILACEYAKACSGGKCKLPSGVTSIVRQGIAMEIPTGAFENGLTGIREVDAYVQRWNPNHLKAGIGVWSPDLAVSTRTTTWP